MEQRICTIDGCGSAHLARGWCRAHYARWARSGDPEGSTRPTPEERFWASVDRGGPVPAHAPELGRCWVWTRRTNADGYAQISVSGRKVNAHRFAFYLHNPESDRAAEIDHACHNPACVRPSHLRLTDRAGNNRNRSGAQKSSRTGVRGVSRARSGRYIARVGSGPTEVHLGTFDTVEQAAAAAAAKRSELWGEFAGR